MRDVTIQGINTQLKIPIQQNNQTPETEFLILRGNNDLKYNFHNTPNKDKLN